MRNCPFCQAQNRPNARFCHHCGKRLAQDASASSTKPALSPTRPLSPLERGMSPPTISVPATKHLSRQQPARTRKVKQPALLPLGKKAWEVQTEPLPRAKSNVAALPAGELLDNRRYVVLAIVREGSKENIYRVWDRQHRYCPQCASTASLWNESSCRDCQRPFSGSFCHPTYFLRETFDKQMWQGQVELTGMRLSHPGLVNLHRTFKSRFYGGIPRFYLLSDIKAGRSLKAISEPLPEESVLEWGKELAEALSYLHRQGMIHGDVRLEKIYLIHKKIKLDLLKSAKKVPQQASSTSISPAQEVEQLGHLLQQLIDPQSLSAATRAFFEEITSSKRPQVYPTAQAFAQAIDEVISTLHSPKSMAHIVGSMSDVGRKRKLNEDSMQSLEIKPAHQQAAPIGLYVVADGMGGHSAGDVASALASQTLRHTIHSKLMRPVIERNRAGKPDYATLLKEACLAANRAVYEQSRKSHNDMGTTLVAVLLVGNHAYIANIGDSRVYLVNQRGIQKLTTDHSLVERLVALKQISPEQARTHPQRNVIFRTVGDKPEVEVDLSKHRLKNRDYLILCSDGLHGMITDEEIHQTIIQSQHPQQAAEQLVKLANQVGGDDNITIIAVKIKQ